MRSKTLCSREAKSTYLNKLREKIIRRKRKSQKVVKSQVRWLTKINQKMGKKLNMKNNSMLKGYKLLKKSTKI